MLRTKWVLAYIILATLTPALAPAAVILQDTFNRTGALDGSSPSSPQTAGDTWVAPTPFTTDTTPEANVDGGSGGSTSALPFTISTPGVYTLSATLTPTAGTSGDWLSIGFLGNNQTVSYMGYSAPGPWAIYTDSGSISFFTSSDTSHPVPYAGTVTSGSSQTLYLQLDTTGATDVANFYVGSDSGTPAYSYTYATNPTVNYVGLGNYDLNGTAMNFQVVAAPEPAGLLIAALAGFVLLRRKPAIHA